LETLNELLTGLSDQAIIAAAKRFSAGDVPEQSMTFAPSTPQLIAVVRREQERIDNSRKRIAGPTPKAPRTIFLKRWDAYKRGELTYEQATSPITQGAPFLSKGKPKGLMPIWDAVDQKFKPKPPLSDDFFGGLP
jgi:hypothetical protein